MTQITPASAFAIWRQAFIRQYASTVVTARPKKALRSRGASRSDSYDGSAEQSLIPVGLYFCFFSSPTQNMGKEFLGRALSPLQGNVSKLLGLSDTIRTALFRGRTLTLSELEDLAFALDMMLLDEIGDKVAAEAPATSQGDRRITVPVIQHTRLDKLLSDIIHIYETEGHPDRPLATDVGLGSEIETARSLQKHWRTRFKSDYFALDKYRLEYLFSNALRDVSFSAVASDGLGVWLPKEVLPAELSEAEASLHYTPGTWWLNIGCAHRDGIVGDAFEKPTKGRYGVAVLPLLTGSEEELPDGKLEYCRRGTQREMHYNLITQVGQKTKVLRGFRLKSVYAPVAGLSYILRSWSLKLDQATEIYTMRLVLERMPGQTPINEILHIPGPSQLDDWKLYEKLEKERIKQTEGDARLTEWMIRRDQERIERDHWRRSRAFKSEVRSNGARVSGAGAGQVQQPHKRKLSSIDTDLVAHSEEPENEE
ncbi:hypothetical protein J7T55_009279 [Diaporthe amygdali]|uniref:uncharacterized protein n=1 Tax=Phomopsis amygdali TaxID=1214568 RepID=UPI0022FEC06E|nr:uncharacterized protein J7T55_009279 [Diaporthe amygdali]KAJ0118496.1 hypothetical protein J7T55_009279 [Diaporthe amygdali]